MLAMAVGGIAIGVHASALTLAYRAGGAPVWSIFAYPIGAVLTARILRQAASDLQAGRPTSWGGIEYARTSQ
ncbi:MAG: hypothetical protein KF705_11970 [Phycisphaeraceae bacterium]|nr:hypothetical protein [Phycisphaeraceae bacterium]